MKNLIILATVLFITASIASAIPQVNTVNIDLDPEEMHCEVMLYQIEISEYTLERLEETYETFQDSFLDYVPALEKINLIINDYYKALQRSPAPVPEDGKKLEELMKVLMSRMEKYFVHHKAYGRTNLELRTKIFEATNELSREIERLVYIYM
ncbi:MAG: hypothetical protein HQ594_04745 [Candidatus Omnitrophica bacterium]|nr:hypothetical protein [Candidatus Omnitrophota bacterium]